MELYRIIMVDDEEEVRKSIIRKIGWEEAGFQVAGDAENGEDALEKIEALEPDVVLTDIRMPYMDGLTLAERIRQKYPSMKIVIFSGYDDFEYAKQAIKLNVTEYILKPVNVEELTAILKRIKVNLDQEIEQKRNVSLLRENYIRSLPILRENFLNELISRHMEPETVEGRMREYDLDLLGARKWIAAAIDIEEPETGLQGELAIHREKDLIPISIMQILEEKLGQYCRFALFNASGARETGLSVIAAIDEDNSQTGVISVLGDICRETRRILAVPVTIGIGNNSAQLWRISDSYKEAVNSLGYKAIVGSGSTIYINDMEPVNRGKLELDGKEEAELIAAVKFGPREKIEEAAGRIMVRMNDAKVHFRQQQVYMLGVANAMIQLLQMYDLDTEAVFNGELKEDGALEMLPGLQKKEDFSVWLLNTALYIHQAMNRERDNTMKQVIKEARQYILEHYQEPELSVEKICSHLHMSPAYFSTMFKKETGKTYVAYLTEVRLDKAVELLNKTDDKTYVIAAKVGYQEQNYFSYVFKKRFGVSPTKFRGAK